MKKTIEKTLPDRRPFGNRGRPRRRVLFGIAHRPAGAGGAGRIACRLWSRAGHSARGRFHSNYHGIQESAGRGFTAAWTGIAGRQSPLAQRKIRPHLFP